MENTFSLFGFQHILAMILGVIGVIVALFFSNANHRVIPKIIAFLALVLKIGELLYRYAIIKEPIIDLLPLHLCNITLILAIIVLLFRADFLFQIIYYWGIGAIFAIVTPDVKRAFPDFATISFFITHFFVLFAPFCCITAFNIKPTLKGFWGSFLALNVFAVIVFFVNRKLGTNYLFINRMPEFSSPLKYFGEWPYYLIILEVLYLIITYILYLPFKRSKAKYISRSR